MSQIKKKRLDAWDLQILKKIAKGLRDWLYAITKDLRGITLGSIQGKLSRLERLGLIERDPETLRYSLSGWGVFCLNHQIELLQFIRENVRKLDPVPYERISERFGITKKDAERFVELFEGLRFGEFINEGGDHKIESRYVHVKQLIYGCEESKMPQIVDLGVLGKRLICVNCGNGLSFSETYPFPVCECSAEYEVKYSPGRGSLIPAFSALLGGLVLLSQS